MPCSTANLSPRSFDTWKDEQTWAEWDNVQKYNSHRINKIRIRRLRYHVVSPSNSPLTHSPPPSRQLSWALKEHKLSSRAKQKCQKIPIPYILYIKISYPIQFQVNTSLKMEEDSLSWYIGIRRWGLCTNLTNLNRVYTLYIFYPYSGDFASKMAMRLTSQGKLHQTKAKLDKMSSTDFFTNLF